MIQIAVINHSTVVDYTEFAASVAAVNIQVQRDFRKYWATSATVFDATGLAIPHGAWVIDVLDNSDQANALGYHNVTAGIPNGRVFAKTCLDDNTSWSVCLSHEVLEALADPYCTRSVSLGNGRLVAQEVGDPCEGDNFGYRINNILVSDFVTPLWFHKLPSSIGMYDFCRHITSPLTLLPGGYASVYSPGQGWHQVYAEKSQRAEASARSWYRACNKEVADINLG